MKGAGSSLFQEKRQIEFRKAQKRRRKTYIPEVAVSLGVFRWKCAKPRKIVIKTTAAKTTALFDLGTVIFAKTRTTKKYYCKKKNVGKGRYKFS